MLIHRFARVGCAALVAAAALSACGSDGPDAYTAPDPTETDTTETDTPADSGTTDAAGTDGAANEAAAATGETAEVKALDNTFIDDEIEVAAGTEVVWKNGGRNDHDIVPVVEGQSWGVGIEAFHPGDSYSHVFTEPGTYRYYCTIHGTADVGMTGTITVD